MELARKFEALSKNDAVIAGGKGASLGEMAQAGIPVPPGFVVLTSAFKRFIEETDINVEIDSILHQVKHEEVHTVENASKEIQALILNAEMPQDIADEINQYFKELNSEFVAVRSSATAEDSSAAAWAGQLDSFLNTTQEILLDNVKKCWASLFTPRAIFYRFEKNMHGLDIAVAVVVQKMIQSEVSGIAFSVHPVTEDRNQLIIEAALGLGEAIVSGQITPDSYVVEKLRSSVISSEVERSLTDVSPHPREIPLHQPADRNDINDKFRILDKNIFPQERGLFLSASGGPPSSKTLARQANEWREIPREQGEQQVLSDEQILELSEIILNIENHYNFPQDIEFAYESGKFFIVQSRPITTLKLNKKESVKVLTNIFSREKSLIYYCMWDISDRKSIELINEKVRNNLFIIPQRGTKGSVWYEIEELEQIKHKLIQVFNGKESAKILNQLQALFKNSWSFLLPYLNDERDIQTIEEFEQYYEALCNFWTCLSSQIYEVSDNEKISSKFREWFINFRSQTESQTEKMSALMDSFLKQELGDDVSFYVTYDEAKELLKKSSKIKSEDIKQRLRGCFMLNGKVFLIDELNKVLAANNLEFEKVEKGTDELKGQIAYKGVIRGKVKVIESFDDLSKLDKGDILATQMTSPKYVSYLNKVAAIITDQGGALCHAAIVARELKKPCIIGTKFATQVLKDGDEVEVDADEGVVRILG